MIYDYEKWSVLEPSDVQNKLNTWPKDYTSIVVTNDAEKEIIYVSSFGYGVFNSLTESLLSFTTKQTARLKMHMVMKVFIVV